jgi:hypothetical protein
MHIHVSKIVPKGFVGITLWPFGIYVSDVKYLTRFTVINHEKIHWEQQKELIGLFFYLLYGIEYVVKFFIYGKDAYRNLAAEREAYNFEHDMNYIYDKRKRFAWLKYIFKKP